MPASNPVLPTVASDPILTAAVDHMRTHHACHTVILYGSRARGDWTPESDYDILGVREGGERCRDARILDGAYLDAFIYPDHMLAEVGPDLLHVRGGLVLVEEEDFGAGLMAMLDAIYDQGPPPWLADEREAARVWAGKMLPRIARDDVEARYRKAWLQMQLLEDYFKARGLWYPGPKEGLLWLAKNDPDTHLAYQHALAPDVVQASLAALVRRVWPEA